MGGFAKGELALSYCRSSLGKSGKVSDADAKSLSRLPCASLFNKPLCVNHAVNGELDWHSQGISV